MITTSPIALQPGQPGRGMDYDPAEELPYPIWVGEDDRCENVPGYRLSHRDGPREALPILVGFQPDPETQSVDLTVEDWREDPQQAVGMVPVFFEPGGFDEGMFSLAVVITNVTDPQAAIAVPVDSDTDAQRAELLDRALAAVLVTAFTLNPGGGRQGAEDLVRNRLVAVTDAAAAEAFSQDGIDDGADTGLWYQALRARMAATR